MKIIQVSDLHLVAPGGIVQGTDPLARFDAAIADINANHADAALVVISGDLTDAGERSAYEVLRQRLESLVPPHRLMLGNHDDRRIFSEVFPDAMDGEFAHSAVDTPEGRMILLDTLEQGRVDGEMSGGRLTWLEQKLDEAGNRSVYIFMHHPPFLIHMPELDNVRLSDTDAFRDLVTGYSTVRHIFAGHVHRLIAGSWYGIPISTLRSTNHQTGLYFEMGWKLSQEKPAYAVVFIDSEGTIVHFHEYPLAEA
jgi:3',5'-cyclic-AMP phosphodiesterase